MTITIIADSNPDFGHYLGNMLAGKDMLVEVVTEDTAVVLRRVSEMLPDLLILGTAFLLADDCALAKALRLLAVPPRLIVLTSVVSEPVILTAIRTGIQALLPKTSIATELNAVLYAVGNGRGYLSPLIMEQVMVSWPQSAAATKATLSTTEEAVLQLLVRDNSQAAIAARLELDGSIVEACRESLLSKLRCTNIGGLVRHALRQGYGVSMGQT